MSQQQQSPQCKIADFAYITSSRLMVDIETGSIADHNYASYTQYTPWDNLAHRDFNLLGVHIIGGHDNANPAIIINIVKTLRDNAVYPLHIIVNAHVIDDFILGYKEEVRITLIPEETDVFIFDAFCGALRMIGWKVESVDTDDDGIMPHLDRIDFNDQDEQVMRFTTPLGWTGNE